MARKKNPTPSRDTRKKSGSQIDPDALVSAYPDVPVQSGFRSWARQPAYGAMTQALQSNVEFELQKALRR